MTTETNEGYRDGAITGGLTTGIIGTSLGALGLLGGGASLLGLGGNRQNQPQWVSKEEHAADMKIAAKDSEIALLKAEKDDEKKMVEVYTALATQINNVKEKMYADKEQLTNRIDLTSENLRTKIDENRDRGDDRLATAFDKLNGKIDFNKSFQDGVNAQQLAYNAGNTGTVACMQKQINQLFSLTQLAIPNENLLPGVPQVYLTHTNPSLSA